MMTILFPILDLIYKSLSKADVRGRCSVWAVEPNVRSLLRQLQIGRSVPPPRVAATAPAVASPYPVPSTAIGAFHRLDAAAQTEQRPRMSASKRTGRGLIQHPLGGGCWGLGSPGPPWFPLGPQGLKNWSRSVNYL